MRLLTHNLLTAKREGVEEGFPLALEVRQVEVRESPLRPDFILKVFETLEWGALRAAAGAVGVASLPEAVDPAMLEDPAFLAALHHVLFDIHVIEGDLVCQQTGRRFPISGGVPDMQLNDETEVETKANV
mmetsp:Transcript_30761/g.97942  ORF Transcript_30761/g.97942 Transcript_30761/m.97942 type:complete len:130 (-) Transcript_30761:317-706(-)